MHLFVNFWWIPSSLNPKASDDDRIRIIIEMK